jgi:hypothetical protein
VIRTAAPTTTPVEESKIVPLDVAVLFDWAKPAVDTRKNITIFFMTSISSAD